MPSSKARETVGSSPDFPAGLESLISANASGHSDSEHGCPIPEGTTKGRLPDGLALAHAGGMEPQRRAGDFILDRYMPDAAPDVREAARVRLYDFVGVMLRIAIRLEEERRAAGDSLNMDGRRKMEP